jgi:hypothetical protein
VGGQRGRQVASWGISGFLFLSTLLGELGCQGPTNVTDDGPAAAIALCPHLAAGTNVQAVDAYDQVNMYRLAVGLPCINFVPAIAAAAAAHCAYYVRDHGSCIASPHREVSTCDNFSAERFGDRMKGAGYAGSPAYEDMTYVGDGANAVDEWVNSIWHRIPILSPYVADAGYGTTGQCDTMDFGWARASASVSAAPVVYPFDQQTGVPTSFAGDLESPAPPRPPKGWPSGYPIIVYAPRLETHTHQLFDARGAQVDHTFIAPGDADSQGILINEIVMYAYRPLEPKAAYRVVIEGVQQGKPLHLEWTFTTR